MLTVDEVFAQATELVAASRLCAASYCALSDEELLAIRPSIAGLAAEVQRQEALWAAELAHRSDRTLGRDGLAARQGFASVTDMVQKSFGGTRHDTTTLLNTGAMLAETEAADDVAQLLTSSPDVDVPASAAIRPWFGAMTDALTSGLVSAALHEAIRAGLGADSHGALSRSAMPSGATQDAGHRDKAEEAVRQLTIAVTEALPELIADCVGLTPEQAQKVARGVRNRVDAAGLLARAEEMRRRQYLKAYVRPDGMVGLSGLFDPENGALLLEFFEQIRHPRRAGVTFRSPEDWATERAASGDLRELDEYVVDGFMQFFTAGLNSDPNKMLESRPPAVRLVVTQAELDRRDDRGVAGAGILQRSNEAVPLATIDRVVCTAGILPVRFDDDGASMNLGRTKRLFSHKQREALAIRDGGCMDPDCDRPISWTEAHHINHWDRDHGKTDLADGILLCHRDHRRYHNHGYEIRRDGTQYWLIPPPGVDPKRTPRLMRSKSGLKQTTQLVA